MMNIHVEDSSMRAELDSFLWKLDAVKLDQLILDDVDD